METTGDVSSYSLSCPGAHDHFSASNKPKMEPAVDDKFKRDKESGWQGQIAKGPASFPFSRSVQKREVPESKQRRHEISIESGSEESRESSGAKAAQYSERNV